MAATVAFFYRFRAVLISRRHRGKAENRRIQNPRKYRLSDFQKHREKAAGGQDADRACVTLHEEIGGLGRAYGRDRGIPDDGV
jgi:hypothetical protein